jgi:IS30 family transposase
VVERKLRQEWSPQQIAAWLVNTYPDESAMHVSHETIYRALYVQARGALKRELIAHLRRHRSYRRPHSASHAASGRGKLVDTVSIAERPRAADNRAVPGHWEGDLLKGKHGTQVATLVERQSRSTLLIRVPAADSATVVAALARRGATLARRPSTIADVGSRQGDGAAHPVHDWDGGAGVLLRSPESVAAPLQRKHDWAAAAVLSQRQRSRTRNATPARRGGTQAQHAPRQTLGWKTPADVLNEAVAFTG